MQISFLQGGWLFFIYWFCHDKLRIARREIKTCCLPAVDPFFNFVVIIPWTFVIFVLPCRPPRKSSRPLESLQKTRYATSRNPRNGAAILAVPRLNLLARPEAATKGEGFGRRALSAVSFRRSAFDVISVTSPRFAEKLQIKNLFAVSRIEIIDGEAITINEGRSRRAG